MALLVACGGAAPSATPPPATPPAAAPSAPSAAGSVDQNLVRTVSVLEQMRGHLMVAQELSSSGDRDHALEQAAYPEKELFDLVSADLAAKGADSGLRRALDAYNAALSGTAAAPPAQTAALSAIDAAIQAVAGASQMADTGFRVAVVRDLLEKVEEEYREAAGDGKIADSEPYQSAYGILLMVRRDVDQLTQTAGAPSVGMQAVATALENLHAALATPQPPATPVSADVVAQEVDAVAAALGRATGTSDGIAPTATLIDQAKAGVQAALDLYKAGQADAAYEKAAAAYLDNFEKLEPDLLKLDKDLVPSLETDFKALRDGIKAGQAQADLDTIAARIDAGLERARGLLVK